MAQIIIDKKIKDFKKDDYVQCYFYIRESEMKTTQTNNKYMNFTFSDSTGNINGKFWDASEDTPRMFPAGKIVKVRGTVTLFQNQFQFKVEQIRVTNETDCLNISDYIPSAPVKGEDELAYIKSVIEKMKDRELADFVLYILDKYNDVIVHFPAAKRNHHAVRDGLMYHTATMLRAAEGIAAVYSFVNSDLLFSGVILHDIGKIREMKTSDYGLVEDYSETGKLLGHITEGVNMISDAAKEKNLDKEKALLLEHMILSHHYEPEFGSPKKPMIPEGEILHYLDTMDASLYDMEKAYEGVEPGTFSEKIYSLDNRIIYKPSWN